MPNSGDKKWMRNTNPTTKRKISKEVGVASNKVGWATAVLGKIAENSMIVPWLISFIGIGTATAAGIFYSQYRDGLKKLLDQIEDYPEDKEFYVEQQYQWHPGHRSWRPLNNFRPAPVKK